jgi:sortase (surface protein transpeptidase)
VARAPATHGARPARLRATPPVIRITRPVPPPVRVHIPSIGIDARLVRLGLDTGGALEVPRRWEDAGWFTGAARPGERGAAVIAGHVDSTSGPAVFYRLGALRAGAAITIGRRDGSPVRFRVRRVERWPKRRFPTRRVYGPTRRPTLRLITCGGAFDRASGHYVDNTIVFATRWAGR